MTLGTVPASRRRLDRARDYLAASGVGALLLVKTENRRYVTGFTGSAGLALIAPAEAFLAVDFRYEEQAAAEATACTVLRGGRDPLAALSAAVAGRSLGTIGFESEFVPFAQVTRLREKLAPAELVPLATVDRLRWTKDATELAAITRAVEIADAAFAHIAGVLRPGLSERAVAFELEMFLRRRGRERPVRHRRCGLRRRVRAFARPRPGPGGARRAPSVAAGGRRPGTRDGRHRRARDLPPGVGRRADRGQRGGHIRRMPEPHPGAEGAGDSASWVTGCDLQQRSSSGRPRPAQW